ncbi:MAG: YjfB family protein [Lachnospiraceae bacterium]|nr:YjfB family protein [Lachnospiraceae bacterium]
MAIPQLSTAVSQANLKTDLGVLVLAKTMDEGEKIGENMVEMLDAAAMERSVNPAVGGNFDMSV